MSVIPEAVNAVSGNPGSSVRCGEAPVVPAALLVLGPGSRSRMFASPGMTDAYSEPRQAR